MNEADMLNEYMIEVTVTRIYPVLAENIQDAETLKTILWFAAPERKS